MKPHAARRAGICTAVVAGAMLAGGLPAAAEPGDGSASGVTVDVELAGEQAVHFGPFAQANTSGPTHDEAASAEVPDVLTTGTITTDATRDDQTGAVNSGATVANLDMGLLAPAAGNITAESLEATCSSTQEETAGSTTLTGLDLGSLDAEVGANPAPDTTVEVQHEGTHAATITFNEQISNSDGSHTVNAMHVELFDERIGNQGAANIVVGSASCGPPGLPIPMASGTGLWVGLGLLGAVAVPVGVRLNQRRSADAAA